MWKNHFITFLHLFVNKSPLYIFNYNLWIGKVYIIFIIFSPSIPLFPLLETGLIWCVSIALGGKSPLISFTVCTHPIDNVASFITSIILWFQRVHIKKNSFLFSGDNTKQQRITKEREFCNRYNLSQKQLVEMSDLIKVSFIWNQIIMDANIILMDVWWVHS